MPRNPTNGTYSFVPTSFTPAINGTVIDAEANNEYLADVENALTESISSKGVTPIQDDLPMSGFKHLNVADAALPNQYASAGQVATNALSWYGNATGTGDIIDIANPMVTEYKDGMIAYFKATATNTTSTPTALQINGFGYKPVLDFKGNPLLASTILAGYIYEVLLLNNSFILGSSSGRSSGDIVDRVALCVDATTPYTATSYRVLIGAGFLASRTLPILPISLSRNDGGTPSTDVIFERGFIYDFVLVGAGGITTGGQSSTSGSIGFLNGVFINEEVLDVWITMMTGVGQNCSITFNIDSPGLKLSSINGNTSASALGSYSFLENTTIYNIPFSSFESQNSAIPGSAGTFAQGFYGSPRAKNGLATPLNWFGVGVGNATPPVQVPSIRSPYLQITKRFA